MFALNLSLYADDIALSASIPGSLVSIQKRSLAVPAEGVWSPSTGAFESGSSFAAPQIVAMTALLLQAERETNKDLIATRKEALNALKSSADRKGHLPSEWGLGLPSADHAVLGAGL